MTARKVKPDEPVPDELDEQEQEQEPVPEYSGAAEAARHAYHRLIENRANWK